MSLKASPLTSSRDALNKLTIHLNAKITAHEMFNLNVFLLSFHR